MIMIKKTLLRSIILILFTLLLVNCSKDDKNDINSAHPLVGSWRFIDLDTDYKLTETLKFNSNKSGSIEEIEEYNGEIFNDKTYFTWSTDVDVLTVIFDDGEIDTVDIYYSIEGNKLSFGDDNTAYTKI